MSRSHARPMAEHQRARAIRYAAACAGEVAVLVAIAAVLWILAAVLALPPVSAP